MRLGQALIARSFEALTLLLMKRTYIGFLGSGALTLLGLGATIVLHGGWEAAGAGFAMLQGIVFALTFIALRVAADGPQSRRPEWGVAGVKAHGAATPEAERAVATVGDGRAERVRSPHPRPPAAVSGHSV